jgi:hypothetical protein
VQAFGHYAFMLGILGIVGLSLFLHFWMRSLESEERARYATTRLRIALAQAGVLLDKHMARQIHEMWHQIWHDQKTHAHAHSELNRKFRSSGNFKGRQDRAAKAAAVNTMSGAVWHMEEILLSGRPLTWAKETNESEKCRRERITQATEKKEAIVSSSNILSLETHAPHGRLPPLQTGGFGAATTGYDAGVIDDQLSVLQKQLQDGVGLTRALGAASGGGSLNPVTDSHKSVMERLRNFNGEQDGARTGMGVMVVKLWESVDADAVEAMVLKDTKDVDEFNHFLQPTAGDPNPSAGDPNPSAPKQDMVIMDPSAHQGLDNDLARMEVLEEQSFKKVHDELELAKDTKRKRFEARKLERKSQRSHAVPAAAAAEAIALVANEKGEFVKTKKKGWARFKWEMKRTSQWQIAPPVESAAEAAADQMLGQVFANYAILVPIGRKYDKETKANTLREWNAFQNTGSAGYYEDDNGSISLRAEKQVKDAVAEASENGIEEVEQSMTIHTFRRFVHDLKLKPPYRISKENADKLFVSCTQERRQTALDAERNVYKADKRYWERQQCAASASSSALEEGMADVYQNAMDSIEMDYDSFRSAVLKLAQLCYRKYPMDEALASFGEDIFKNCRLVRQPAIPGLVEHHDRKDSKFSQYLGLCKGTMEEAIGVGLKAAAEEAQEEVEDNRNIPPVRRRIEALEKALMGKKGRGGLEARVTILETKTLPRVHKGSVISRLNRLEMKTKIPEVAVPSSGSSTLSSEETTTKLAPEIPAPTVEVPKADDHRQKTKIPDTAQDHRQRLLNFYETHNPTKVDTVDATIEKYAGREQELFQKLQHKYNCEVPSYGSSTLSSEQRRLSLVAIASSGTTTKLDPADAHTDVSTEPPKAETMIKDEDDDGVVLDNIDPHQGEDQDDIVLFPVIVEEEKVGKKGDTLWCTHLCGCFVGIEQCFTNCSPTFTTASVGLLFGLAVGAGVASYLPYLVDTNEAKGLQWSPAKTGDTNWFQTAVWSGSGGGIGLVVGALVGFFFGSVGGERGLCANWVGEYYAVSMQHVSHLNDMLPDEGAGLDSELEKVADAYASRTMAGMKLKRSVRSQEPSVRDVSNRALGDGEGDEALPSPGWPFMVEVMLDSLARSARESDPRFGAGNDCGTLMLAQPHVQAHVTYLRQIHAKKVQPQLVKEDEQGVAEDSSATQPTLVPNPDLPISPATMHTLDGVPLPPTLTPKQSVLPPHLPIEWHTTNIVALCNMLTEFFVLTALGFQQTSLKRWGVHTSTNWYVCGTAAAAAAAAAACQCCNNKHSTQTQRH